MAESYSADRDVEGAFWAWFDGEGGWRLKSVDFFSTMSDGVRGVVARQAIKKKAPVLRIPLDMCIRGKEGGEAAAAMAAQAAEVDPFLATVLSTHFEMSSGASHYAPYIRSLPTEVRCPMVGTTSDEELRAIADMAVGPVVCAGKEVSLLESTAFPLLKTMALSAKTRGLRAWAAEAESPQFRARFLHCYALVSSRSFRHDNITTPLMVPLQDQLNHSSDPALCNVSLESTATGFEVRAQRAIAPGEQLLFSYGEYSDAEQLAAFGFVEALHQPSSSPNPFNWLPVAGDMALQAIEHEVSAKKQCGTAAASARVRRGDAEGKMAARTGAIQQSGLLSDIRITAKEPLPLVITTAAQVLMMDDAAFAAWKTRSNAILAPAMLPLHDIGSASVRQSVLRAHLAVADAALASRQHLSPAAPRSHACGGKARRNNKRHTGADAAQVASVQWCEDGGYMKRAIAWVLAQEQSLLVSMREAALDAKVSYDCVSRPLAEAAGSTSVAKRRKKSD